jgi:hypothetical protein
MITRKTVKDIATAESMEDPHYDPVVTRLARLEVDTDEIANRMEDTEDAVRSMRDELKGIADMMKEILNIARSMSYLK